MENSSSDERADGFGYDSEPGLVPKRRKMMLDGEDGSDEEAWGSSMMLVDDEATVDSGPAPMRPRGRRARMTSMTGSSMIAASTRRAARAS